jgi:putative phage-type endonuclease
MINLYATDIASVLGLNPFETSWMLLEKKIEDKHKFSGNKFTEHGNKYENSALIKYQNESNIKVVKDNKTLKHKVYNWLTGIVDGITENNKIIEIKCPYRKKRNINSIDDIPKHYWVQCQVYMNLLDIDNTDYVEYYIKPGSPTDGKYGSISTFNIQKDNIWWENNLPKIIKFHEELTKWKNIGSLDQHPVRVREKEWEHSFSSSF